MDKEFILASANAEQEALPADWAVPVHLDMVSLMCVIGTLQVALRHPEFRRRPTAAAVQQIIDQLISGIPENCPATRELARLGNNPAYDT